MNDSENQEKMLDLLTLREIYGLSEEEQQDLERLLQNFPEWQDDETLALTAAAITLAVVETDEPMPANLRSRILASSERYFANEEISEEASGKVLDFKSKRVQTVSGETEVVGGFADRLRRLSFWNLTGWVAAAAACVVLGFNLWTTNAPDVAVKSPPSPQISPTPLSSPNLAQQREQFLTAAPDAVQSSWTDFNPKQPRNVKGDVVWSNSLQRGYIRFQNLPVNDKTRETYQLWIFDANQNAKTPVDGGVFDIDANGDVIVPIDAKIKVGKPTMFAVTAEKPGGVVVSELGKVMAVAKIET
ncbi:MAG: anti-sigma factor [Acidobacteriota bacterium]|nr:anti-sigma factor [Acidobacteriota bacterium]